MSYSGTQFMSRELQEHGQSNDFSVITSCPHFHQSNENPYRALLEYRVTPGPTGYSPAQLLMGRSLRTGLPVLPEKLNPKLPNHHYHRAKDQQFRLLQKTDYDRRHRVVQRRPFKIGDQVWLTNPKTFGVVRGPAGPPRFYLVETPRGVLRRNSFHMIPRYAKETTTEFVSEQQKTSQTLQVTPETLQARPVTVPATPAEHGKVPDPVPVDPQARSETSQDVYQTLSETPRTLWTIPERAHLEVGPPTGRKADSHKVFVRPERRIVRPRRLIEEK